MTFSKLLSSIHLYAGLFLAPFAALFAVSVLVLNHNPVPAAAPESRREVAGVVVPPGLETLEGRARVDALRPVLDRLGVRGEVSFIQYSPKQGRIVVPVTTPVTETTVTFNLAESSASIVSRKTGWLRGSVYLHKMPGPHLANIRGNWVWTQVWRVFADATVYLVLLVTTSGIWLWWLLRPQRRTGLTWLACGIVVFAGVICALVL